MAAGVDAVYRDGVKPSDHSPAWITLQADAIPPRVKSS